jgi:hypothetical protein
MAMDEEQRELYCAFRMGSLCRMIGVIVDTLLSSALFVAAIVGILAVSIRGRPKPRKATGGDDGARSGRLNV